MRIEITTPDGYRHTIDTTSPDLAGKWLTEKCVRLMSANAAWGDHNLRIWPQTPEENALIGQHDTFISQDALLKLAEAILTVSARLGELEAAHAARG